MKRTYDGMNEVAIIPRPYDIFNFSDSEKNHTKISEDGWMRFECGESSSVPAMTTSFSRADQWATGQLDDWTSNKTIHFI